MHTTLISERADHELIASKGFDQYLLRLIIALFRIAQHSTIALRRLQGAERLV